MYSPIFLLSSSHFSQKAIIHSSPKSSIQPPFKPQYSSRETEAPTSPFSPTRAPYADIKPFYFFSAGFQRPRPKTSPILGLPFPPPNITSTGWLQKPQQNLSRFISLTSVSEPGSLECAKGGMEARFTTEWRIVVSSTNNFHVLFSWWAFCMYEWKLVVVGYLANE